MNYKITIDENRKLIIVKYESLVGFHDRVNAVKECVKLLADHDYTGILIDLRDAKINMGLIRRIQFRKTSQYYTRTGSL